MLEVGAILKKKYRVNGIVGRGGQNVVYRATDIKKGFFERNEVALKEMRWTRDIRSDMASLEFFRQEVVILSKLNHPYLPQIYEIFIEGGMLYIVEEFIEGQTLEKLLKNGERMDLLKALEIGLKIADILDFLHQQSTPVYYRDLKPSNIIMQPERLYLVDFSGCYIPGFFKGEGVSIRTQGYCPPEAYKCTTADAAFDVYTLGMLLYRLVTGFNVGKFTSPAPPLNAKKDKLPPSLVKIINKATKKNKMSRYHTIWEMKFDLQRVHDQLREAIKREDPVVDAAVQDKMARQKTQQVAASLSGGEKEPDAQQTNGDNKNGSDKKEIVVPRISFKYQVANAVKSIVPRALDLTIIAIFPLMFSRHLITNFLPFELVDVPWKYLWIFLAPVLFIHILYRHWFDWMRNVADFNRKLNVPLQQLKGIRPINGLLVLEVILLLYIFSRLVAV